MRVALVSINKLSLFDQSPVSRFFLMDLPEFCKRILWRPFFSSVFTYNSPSSCLVCQRDIAKPSQKNIAEIYVRYLWQSPADGPVGQDVIYSSRLQCECLSFLLVFFFWVFLFVVSGCFPLRGTWEFLISIPPLFLCARVAAFALFVHSEGSFFPLGLTGFFFLSGGEFFSVNPLFRFMSALGDATLLP